MHIYRAISDLRMHQNANLLFFTRGAYHLQCARWVKGFVSGQGRRSIGCDVFDKYRHSALICGGFISIGFTNYLCFCFSRDHLSIFINLKFRIQISERLKIKKQKKRKYAAVSSLWGSVKKNSVQPNQNPILRIRTDFRRVPFETHQGICTPIFLETAANAGVCLAFCTHFESGPKSSPSIIYCPALHIFRKLSNEPYAHKFL